MGDDRGARRVLYEMEHRFRHARSGSLEGGLKRALVWLADLVARAGNGILRWTIGYGVYPLRAFPWLVGLWLLGAICYHFGYIAGAMTPVGREAYAFFQQRRGPPHYYQPFNSIEYSLENSVPVLRLGQDDKWAPVPAPRAATRVPWWLTWPALLRLFRCVQIMGGWVLVTLFLAGVTGVVRKE